MQRVIRRQTVAGCSTSQRENMHMQTPYRFQPPATTHLIISYVPDTPISSLDRSYILYLNRIGDYRARLTLIKILFDNCNVGTQNMLYHRELGKTYPRKVLI